MAVASIANDGTSGVPWGGTGRTSLDTYQFLRLLLTELTSQNPLEPLKDREFMTQLAQLHMAQHLQHFSMVTTGLQAASLVGRQVEVFLSDGTPLQGTVEWVEMKSGRVYLHIGEHSVPFESLRKVW